MSERYAVIGPLVEPPNRSGVHDPGCTHVAPDSCPRCDGQAAEEREYWSATPAQRRAYLAQLAAYERGEFEPTTYAEEAKPA